MCERALDVVALKSANVLIFQHYLHFIRLRITVVPHLFDRGGVGGAPVPRRTVIAGM